jgi:hypothetical protein
MYSETGLDWDGDPELSGRFVCVVGAIPFNNRLWIEAGPADDSVARRQGPGSLCELR